MNSFLTWLEQALSQPIAALLHDVLSALTAVRELTEAFADDAERDAHANIWAALQLAKRPEFAGKRIVAIACSPSERYLSTALAEKVRAEVTALTAS